MLDGDDNVLPKLSVTLRPVTADDALFLLTVYEAGREMEMSMVPWDSVQKHAFLKHQFEAQSRYYADKFPAATHDVILLDNVQVGRLYLDRSQDHISILDITVLRQFREQGVGSLIIKKLQKEAAEAGKSLGIYVETFNPSQKLFKALGFSVVSDDGVNLRMEWSTS